MSKRIGTICITAGAVLMASALLLLAYNEWEARQAQAASQAILENMLAAREEETPPEEPPVSEEEPVVTEMPVRTIDGYDYIGYLSVPSVGLTQPVMAEWDEARLKIAPCRQFGSYLTDDLVIAGHNYKKSFRLLHQAEAGDTVTFTDVADRAIDYLVSEKATLAPTEVDRVQNSGHDLVLYTCTVGGAKRVVLFCDRLEP